MLQISLLIRRPVFWAVLCGLCLVFVIRACRQRSRPPEAAMSDQIVLTVRLEGYSAARKLALQTNNQTPANAFWRSNLWCNLWRDADRLLYVFQGGREGLPELADNSMLAGFSLQENDQMHAVYAVKWEKNNLETFLKAHPDRLRYQSAQFQGIPVFTLELANGERIVLAHHANLLLFSRLSYLVEDAIDQLQDGGGWWDNRKFRLSADTPAPIQVAVRPDRFVAQFAGRPDASGPGVGALLRWAACAWDGKKAAGAAIPGLFSPFGEASSPDALSAILPDDPALIVWANLQEKPWWLHAGQSTVFKDFIKPWVGTEIALVLSEAYGLEQCRVLAVQNEQAAARAFDRYGEKYGLLKKYTYQTYTVWHFFKPDIVGSQSNAAPGHIRNPACAILGGYAVFAPSTAVLETWIDKLIVNQTLRNQPDWLLLRKSMPEKLQALIAFHGAQTPRLLGKWASDKTLRQYEDLTSIAGQTGFLALTVSNAHKNPWRLEIWAKPNTTPEPSSAILWKMPLDAPARGTPHIFKRNGGGNHILIQDEGRQLYCVDENGRLLWRRQLPEQIQSEIFCLDYLRNGRNHFLFNTAHHILLLDDQGADVSGFPLKLKSPATNGLLAADFDQNAQYTFFIACQNGNTYGFDRFGRPLEGWNPQSEAGAVHLPLQRLQTAHSDLLLALNEADQLWAFSRRGERKFGPISMEGRFRQPPQVDTSAKRIVCANTAGKIYVINPNGAFFTLEPNLSDKKSDAVTLLQQLGGDSQNELAVLYGKNLAAFEIRDRTLKKIFQSNLAQAPDTLFGVPGLGIGMLHANQKKINLTGNKGKPYSGFPLAAETPFATAPITPKSALLVAGYDRFLYAYKILY